VDHESTRQVNRCLSGEECFEVSWRRTNDVLREIKELWRLSQIVNIKLLKYFGHVTRPDNDDLEMLVVYKLDQRSDGLIK